MAEEWKEERLSALEAAGSVELGRGQVISKKDIAARPGIYPIYSSSARNGGLFGHYADYMFDEELISWSVDGGGYFFYRPKHRFSVTNVSGFLRVTSESICCRYLAFSLQHQHRSLSFDYTHKAHPSVIRDLYKVPLPPLPEQRKIAAILSSVDEAIEKTQAVIDQVQVVKKGLMQELLTRGIPGRHTRFKQTEIGEIPEEWELLVVEEVAARVKHACAGGPFGSSLTSKHYTESGVPVIRGSNLSTGIERFKEDEFAFVSETKADELSRNLAARGDVIFTQRGTMGQVGLIPKDSKYERYVVSQSQMKVTFDASKVLPEFAYHYFKSPVAERYLVLHTVGTGVPHINLGLLKKWPMPVPRLAEQQQVLDVLTTVEQREVAENEKLRALEATKSGLMSVLLTGEVRVKVDEEDEVAA